MSPDEVYFVSDTHFFHRLMISPVLENRRRPFDTIEQMNEVLIENWNSVVPVKGAHVFHLGDLSFGTAKDTVKVLSRLNGQKYLIMGNHDHRAFQKHFAWTKDYYELKVWESKTYCQRVILFHYPIGSWHNVHYNSWQLHGHCHGGYRYTRGKQLDVGVDALPGYRPYTYLEIKQLMLTKQYEQLDYHTPKELYEETESPQEGA